MVLETHETQPLLDMQVKKINFDPRRGQRFVEFTVNWLAWKDGMPIKHSQDMKFKIGDTFDFRIPTASYLAIVRQTLTNKVPSEIKVKKK